MVLGAVDTETIEIRKNYVIMIMFQNKSNDNFQSVASHIDPITVKTKDKVINNWAQ